MASYLWIGSAFGALFGLLHGAYLYRQIATRAVATGSTGFNVRALYYGVFTFALWTLFGSYILALWLVGAIANGLVRINRRRNAG